MKKRRLVLAITLFISCSSTALSVGDKFYEALFGNEALEPLLETKSNWRYIAKFKYAARNIGSSEAVSIYSDLANDPKAPDILRELAEYLEVMNSLNSNINKEKINNLEFSTIYPYSAREAMAIAKIHDNDIPSAVKILRSLLNDIKCPFLIKINAQELLQIYDNQ
jgi:hypothetical protein